MQQREHTHVSQVELAAYMRYKLDNIRPSKHRAVFSI